MSEENQVPEPKLLFLDGAPDDGVPAVAEAVSEEEAAETVTEDVVEDVEEDQPKKKTGSQRAREKAQRLEVEVEYLRRQLETREQPKPEVPKKVDTGAPKADDFEDHDEYMAARIDYGVEQRLKAEKEQAEASKRLSSWESRVTEVKSELEDYDDVVSTAPAPSQAVAAELLESALGPKVAYYLGNNLSEYEQINQMDPRSAARAIWEIERKLKEPTKAPPPKTTAAPKPPTPVAGASITTPKLSKKGYEVGY